MKILFALLLFGLPISLSAQDGKTEAQTEGIEKQLRLADELESQGDGEGALEVLQKLSDSDPENADLLKRVAGLLIQSERYKEAIPPLRKMLEIKEGKAGDYLAVARLMIEAEENEAAVPFLKDAAKRFPESADFALLLTFPLARLERWKEAIAEFEKTVEMAKGEAADVLEERFYFRYAAAHERAGQFEEAEKFFRKTLDLLKSVDPTDENREFTATTLNYLAYMWVERGEELDEAGELASAAAKLSPESGAIADTLGWYHFQKGNYPRALVELKKAERLIEEPDPVIFDHLGQTLVKLNEKTFAAEYFRKALELDPKNEEIKARLAGVKE